MRIAVRLLTCCGLQLEVAAGSVGSAHYDEDDEEEDGEGSDGREEDGEQEEGDGMSLNDMSCSRAQASPLEHPLSLHAGIQVS